MSLPVVTRMFRRLRPGLALLGLACVALGARADALPAMTAYSGVTLFGGALSIDTVNCSGFAPCGRSTGYADLYANSSISAGPVIATTVQTPGWNNDIPGYVSGFLQGSVDGSLTYTFAVVGPDPLVVPIVMTGAIYLDAIGQDGPYVGSYTAGSSGHAYLRVANNYPGSPHYVRGDAATASCDPVHRDACNTGFSLSTTMLSSTATTLGEVAWVELAASSFFGCGYCGASSASATVDPLVRIDPVFLAAHPGYSLVFADGLANQAAAVPEGGTGLLLIAGLGVVGSWRGARRR